MNFCVFLFYLGQIQKLSEMATSTKYELQIIPCDMCNGYINKVKRVLRKLAGVKLLTTDFENEKFTISSVVEHPEVIKSALEQKFPGKRVILLPETNHPNPLVPTHYMPIPQNRSSQGGNARVHDMLEALVTLSQAQGLQSGEFTQTIRISVTNNVYQPNISRNSTPLPPPTTQPSAPPYPTTQEYVYGAPPISNTQDYVYGYPSEYYNDCTIV